jgi:hypothetical protein
MTRQNNVSGLVPKIGEYCPVAIDNFYVEGVEKNLSDFENSKLNCLLPKSIVDWKDEVLAGSSGSNSTHERDGLSDSDVDRSNSELSVIL